MKVKKFRIKPRLGIVARNLRSMLAVKQLSLEIENSIQTEGQNFVSRISPAAFYVNWTGRDIPSNLEALLQRHGSNKAVAVSAIVATIGTGPEEALSQFLLSGDTVKSQIWTALSEDGAELAFNFIFKLLIEDAEKDDCEVPEVMMLTEEPVLSETLNLLGAEQDDVRLDKGHLSPRFTRIGLAAWIPVSKKKGASLLARKAN